MVTLPIHVTQNAVDRYRERINARLTHDEVVAEIRASERAIRIAARFGCATVRTARAKLVLDGERVVTVLPTCWINLTGAMA